MKEPDKIYLEKERETNKISHLWGTSPVLHSGYEHIEYIRKDVLLEWAKEKADDYKGTANIRRSFEMMIKKIESL